MKLKYILYLSIAFLFIFPDAYAQKKDKQKITSAQNNQPHDEANPTDSTHISQQKKDSILIEELTLQLQEMKMNEILLRNEFEENNKQGAREDSIRKAKQRMQIDSLRNITQGVPIVIEGDTLFQLYTKRGGVTPKDRAHNTEELILKFGKTLSLNQDSIYVFNGEFFADIMYGDKVIASITDQDGLWQNKDRVELAKEYSIIIANKIDQLHQEYGLMMKVKRILLFTLTVVIQITLIVLTNKLFKKLRRKIVRFSHNKLKPIQIKEYEFLNTHKQARILLFLSAAIKLIFIAAQLIITIPILFSIFPETEDLAIVIFSYVWNPIKSIFISVGKYIPNILKIIVIYFCFKYIIRGLKYLATEIATEKLKINGFFPDWAYPTYYIIRFLFYSFMVIMIWPLLPNSDSPVFSGVSVFIGLIISLGSTTVIGNLMAGMIITYMRPFRKGDQIKINDTVGCVIEKSPFVTRIRTRKNEVVTIPNSFIMSSHTTNYTTSAQQYGIILHTDVTVGYEVEVEVVHELLLSAARETSGILKNPKPFVLNTELSDFYCCYQINGFTREDKTIPRVYSELHQRIREKFNEAGIEMLSPHYYAQRDGNEIAMPKKYTGKTKQ